MKPANKRAAFILFIALAIVAGWWLSRPSQVSAPVAEAKVIPPNASVSQPLTKSADLPKIVQPYARTPMLNLADPRWKDYEIKRKMDPSWEWKVPIEFFGKILDDKNQPVANAEINGVERLKNMAVTVLSTARSNPIQEASLSLTELKGKE